MWLLGVVVRRYIDLLILLIPTPLVAVLFTAASLLIFVNVFINVINNIFTRYKLYMFTLHQVKLAPFIINQLDISSIDPWVFGVRRFHELDLRLFFIPSTLFLNSFSPLLPPLNSSPLSSGVQCQCRGGAG